MNRKRGRNNLVLLVVSIVVVGLASVIAIAAPDASHARFHNAPPSAAQQKNPYECQPAAVKAGEELYTQNCAACHAPNAAGVGTFPPLRTGPTQSAPSGEVFWFITAGNSLKGMPSFRTLPRQQRWQLVTYLKSLSSPQPKCAPASSTKFGAQDKMS
jgi:mono/diheme cytochrome c family protein